MSEFPNYDREKSLSFISFCPPEALGIDYFLCPSERSINHTRVLLPSLQEVNLERHCGFHLCPRLLGRRDWHPVKVSGLQKQICSSFFPGIGMDRGQKGKTSTKCTDVALAPTVPLLQRPSTPRTLLIPTQNHQRPMPALWRQCEKK